MRRVAARLDGPFTLVFADPPYDLVEALTPTLFALMQQCLSPSGVGIIEHRQRDPAPEPPDGLVRDGTRGYGETALAFYARRP